MVIGNPFPLKANAGKSFQGCIVLGKGFVLTIEEAEALIAKDKRNKDVLFPYLNGDDLNNDPQQKPSRWVINFFDWTEEKARTYPDCFEIVEQLVKPERMEQNDKGGKEQWWRFLRPRKELYETISKLDQVMVVARISKTLAMCFVKRDMVFADALVIFNNNSFSIFAMLQSTIHNVWAWKYCTTMKSDLNYTPGNVFETFPLPQNNDNLEELGVRHHAFRSKLLNNIGIGLTKAYNLFHNCRLSHISQEDNNLDDKAFGKKHGKDGLWLRKHILNTESISYNKSVELIEELRDLQVKIDFSVLEAYGWIDIKLQHGFYDLEYLPESDRNRFTIHPEARKEILSRLLKLNHELHRIEKKNDNESKGLVARKSKGTKENKSPTLF